jgi:hypothetical protein
VVSNDGAIVGDFGDGFADACFAYLAGGRDVDIEGLRANHFTGVVVQSFPDGSDVAAESSSWEPVLGRTSQNLRPPQVDRWSSPRRRLLVEQTRDGNRGEQSRDFGRLR